RGYGHPRRGNTLALAPVEAAHLLFRGDLDAIDGYDFQAFVDKQAEGFLPRFLVYKDLRDRGFYLTPGRETWIQQDTDADFLVYPRGKGPWDNEVEYYVFVYTERETIDADSLSEEVLAIVDEESEITYFQTGSFALGDSTSYDYPDISGQITSNRVLVWDPPESLYTDAFFGQSLVTQENITKVLQLSLLEATYLVQNDILDLPIESPTETLKERGRAVEGERFWRRLQTYTLLRDHGYIPKTGFKFGADFRVYSQIKSVSDLGHSSHLVQVLPPGYTFEPRDVRLANGVKKQMLFARTTQNHTINWLIASRLTP
ncbi:MAG: tRNA-intron lyase, partial [Halobacteriaceae archaeon]